MATPRHLTNAPITEALVDVGVVFGEPPNYGESPPAETFSKIGDAISGEYPTRDERFFVAMQYNTAQKSGHTDASLSGYLYRPADKTRAVQSKRDGFTFSQLKPYRDWPSMVEEAARLWAIYRDLFRPTRVVKLSTRFINRLELRPIEGLDFDHYLTCAPRVPSSLPQSYTSFLSAIATTTHLDKSIANVRVSFDARQVKDSVPVVLDIDIIRFVDLAPEDDAAIWASVEELRPIKNSVFFDSLTDKALEAFA